jgi:oligosaccharyltransferase complex subunit delta (ribophorin II)
VSKRFILRSISSIYLQGDVNLKFLDDGTPMPAGRRDDISDTYKPLPEIKHLFRQPDPRPPASVSSLFTLLVTVVPGLILVIGVSNFCSFYDLHNRFQWLAVGVNFGHMPLSPFTLGFHGGLACILGLYGMFWLRLDMFVTLKYLTLIGAVTFMCGNVMLRTMAERRMCVFFFKSF